MKCQIERCSTTAPLPHPPFPSACHAHTHGHVHVCGAHSGKQTRCYLSRWEHTLLISERRLFNCRSGLMRDTRGGWQSRVGGLGTHTAAVRDLKQKSNKNAGVGWEESRLAVRRIMKMGDERRGSRRFGGAETHKAAQIKPPKTTRVHRRRTQTGHRGPRLHRTRFGCRECVSCDVTLSHSDMSRPSRRRKL